MVQARFRGLSHNESQFTGELLMRIFQLAILAATAPLILCASTVDFDSSNDTVSFNQTFSDSLTLGSNNCTYGGNATCTLTGTQNIGGTIYTFTFTMPNDFESPFTDKGDPSSITTSGSPTLDVTISDNHGDVATGTYTLTNLNPDGGTGVDIDGTISIKSITSGSKISTFDSLLGLPSSTALSFVLDVGDCTSGYRSTSCMGVGDPTAQFLSLDITPGTLGSAVPEPATWGLLSIVSGAMFIVVRRRRSVKV
jgi:PEP-CTERM motif